MSFVPNVESNRDLRSRWPILAIIAILVVVTGVLYFVAGQGNAAWHWLPAIAMGYLLSTGLATTYYQWRGGVVTAVVGALAIAPLFVQGWQQYPSGILVSLGAIILIAFSLTYPLARLFTPQQQYQDRSIVAEELSRRKEELAAIQEIDHVLGTTLDTQHVLDLVLDHAFRFLNASVGVIGTLSDDGKYLDIRSALGLDPEKKQAIVSEPWLTTLGIMGKAASSGETVYVSDVDRDSDYVTLSPEIRSELAVPLKSKERVIGILNLESKSENAFDERTIRFVQHLAEHATIALEKAQLYSISERRATETQELYDIATLIGSTLDLDELLEKIITRSTTFLKAEKGILLVLDPTTQTLVPHPSGIYGADPGSIQIRIPLSDGLKAGVLYQGQPFTSHDAIHDSRILEDYRPLVSAFQVETLISIPLRLGDRYIGEIHLCNKERGCFDENDVRLLSMIASHFTIAIANAQTYKLTNRQLRSRIDELTAMQRISSKLNATLNLDQVLDVVIDEAFGITEATFGYIALAEEQNTDCQPIVWRGYSEAELEGFSCLWQENGKTIADAVIQSGQATIVVDTEPDPALEFANGARSALIVPVFYGDEVAGLIHLLGTEPNTFTHEQKQFVESLASQATLAIRNARLYESQVRQHNLALKRAEQIAQLASVGNAFRLGKSLPEMMQLTAQSINEGVGFRSVMISLVEETPPVLDRVAAVGIPHQTFEEMQLVKQPLALIQGIMREEFRIGQLYYIPHEHKAIWQDSLDVFTFDQVELDGHWNADDLLIVPMYGMGHKILGIITVDRPADGFVLDESAVETLQVFAQQAATAVENHWLYEDLQRRIENLMLINQVGQAITAGLEQEEALEKIVAASAQLLQCEYSILLFWDRDAERLIPRVAHGFSIDDSETLNETEFNELTLLVIKGGHSIIVPDISEDPKFSGIYAQSLGLRSMLTVPLVEGTTVSGALVAGATRTGAFGKTDQILLSTLADQASVAIQNARLYSGVVSRAAELEMLNEIGKTIISSLDMDKTLSLIMAQVGEALNAEAGSLLLMEGNYLKFSVTYGPTSEQLKGLVLELGQGIAGWVAQTGESQLVNDVKADMRHFGDIDTAIEYQTRSLLCAPLKGPGNRIIGVIEVVNPLDGGLFTAYHLKRLESLATFAVIAIENAHLFAQRERKITELAILNETGRALSATLRQDDLLELIYQQVARVMEAQNFYIALYDPDQDLVSFPIAYESGIRVAGPDVKSVAPEWRTRKGRKGLTEYIIETGNIVWLPDRVMDRLKELGLERIGLEALSWLGVPIFLGDQVLGIIAVQSHSRENAYDQDHRDLLTTIAGHASVAIQNARLFDLITSITENLESLVDERTEALARANQDLMVQRDRLNTLYQITRELSSSLEPSRVLNRALALINHAVGAQLGFILLRDPELEQLVYTAVIGTRGSSADGQGDSIPLPGQVVSSETNQGIVDWIMGRPEPIRIDDLEVGERWQPPGHQEDPYRSMLANQLASGVDVVGAIVLYHHEKSYFTHDHQRMLDAIASQVGIMVSNAEMFRLLREATGRLGKMLLAQQLEAAKSQAILEGVADGVMVMDAKGSVTLFNLAAERIFQISRDDVIGREAAEMSGFYHLTGTSWPALTEMWAGQELADLETVDGEAAYEERFEVDNRAVSMRVAPVIRQGMFEGIVAVFRDITKDVEVDRIKSEFVSMVSHELRTPMTSIKGYIDLLYNEMAGPVSDGQKRFLQIVKENADRLTSLVNDLLDISRIDTGRVSLSVEAKDPIVIINNVIRDLTPNARERHQSLYNDVEGTLPMVRVDPARTTQILTNLVSNAIKYTPTGGRIRINAQVEDKMLHIHVSDNGIGISKEDQEKLFTRFFRAEDALVQASNGTGLGLSIARSFAELQGGQIWFESEVGNGTTFSFSLPLADELDATSAPHEFRTISYRAQDKHILVIEDEVDVANQISSQLRSQGGYRVHIARTGQDALAYLANKDHVVDLITLDLRLPDTDGFSVLRKIKNDKSLQDIPVVIASILHREKEGRVLGAQAYVPKPIQSGQLLATIEQILIPKGRVLVVEDDLQIAGMLRDALEQHGYTVSVAHNGKQAMQVVKKENPGMILLDIKLPGLNGYQILSQLKEAPETHDIPVIMITGNVIDAEDNRQRVLDMGAAQFLTKPLSIEDLIVKIQKAVQDVVPSN